MYMEFIYIYIYIYYIYIWHTQLTHHIQHAQHPLFQLPHARMRPMCIRASLPLPVTYADTVSA